jgi:hypothetical protein
LHLRKQTGTVVEYKQKFHQLVYQINLYDPAITSEMDKNNLKAKEI